jgi:hypothetical protein
VQLFFLTISWQPLIIVFLSLYLIIGVGRDVIRMSNTIVNSLLVLGENRKKDRRPALDLFRRELLNK